jgi:anti-sigma factor RsiW
MTPVNSEQLEALLPWYLNGTLDPERRALVEVGLGQDREGQATYALLREVSHVSKTADAPFDEQASLARLLSQIHSAQVTRQASAWTGGWAARLFQWFEPKFALALVLIAVQGGIITALWTRQDLAGYAEYRSAFTPGAQQVVYRITFVPTATEGEIRQLLLSTGAAIVHGPSQLGDYYLELRQDPEKASQALANSRLVDSVRRLDHVPPELVNQR